MSIELWRDIIGYEALYQVSSFGSFKSLDRIIISNNGTKRLFKGNLLIQEITSIGRYRVKLYNNGIKKNASS